MPKPERKKRETGTVCRERAPALHSTVTDDPTEDDPWLPIRWQLRSHDTTRYDNVSDLDKLRSRKSKARRLLGTPSHKHRTWLS